MHSENEILAGYKARFEADKNGETEDPKKIEELKNELKKAETRHKKQLTENRKLRKENNDLKKKLVEIEKLNTEKTETEKEQTATNSNVPESGHSPNVNPSAADIEDTQCEIPQVKTCYKLVKYFYFRHLAC